ncbi:MAG TPA: DUF2284 domain-containing protein [Mobilitalea sp.]|nr:DUF2284 domain-containing protein [Mobilitalea sp.]
MNIHKESLYAATPQAKIEYQIYIADTGTEEIAKYENQDRLNALCQSGCENYGRKWSCPPYAPSYQKFTAKFNHIYICLSLAKTDQFDYIKHNYLKIKAANTILKSRIDKTLRKLLDEDVSYISGGSCRLCKSCKCKLNEACIHPELMTYSFEAMGINVDDMVRDIFGIPLQWYKKNYLPEYTCVVAGLVSKDKFDAETIIKTMQSLN